MKGRWFIDNKDLYAKYSLGIVKGGYNDLLVFPSFKDLPSNDWKEYDGIEVDLSEPKMDSREIEIRFATARKDNFLIDNFIRYLNTPGYKTFYMKTLNRKFDLRLIGESSRELYRNGEIVTLRFSDDRPRQMLEDNRLLAASPEKLLVTEKKQRILVNAQQREKMGYGFPLASTSYKLDGTDFGDYGLIVSKGKSSVYAMPDRKEMLTYSISTEEGKYYDVGQEKEETYFSSYASKEITLDCTLLSPNIEHFWKNYNIFFYNLTQPGERKLYVDYLEDEYGCYYKSMSVSDFVNRPSCVYCSFSLTLVFTDYVPSELIQVLGTQNKLSASSQRHQPLAIDIA